MTKSLGSVSQPKSGARDGGNQVYVLAGRWTVPEGESTEGLEEKIKMVLLMNNVEHFVFQLEKGEKTQRLHYQMWLQMKEKIRPNQLGRQLHEHLYGIEIQRASLQGRVALKTYCMKTDTRVAGPWADREIYMGEDIIKELKKWQLRLKDYLLNKTPKNPRQILWVVDAIGGAGKSAFCKYMDYHHKIPKISFGKATDILHMVAENQNAIGYTFDLSRTKPATLSMTEIYNAMEEVKNGHFMTGKYNSKRVFMRIPNMVIFANFKPKLEALSADRWKIIDISTMF